MSQLSCRWRHGRSAVNLGKDLQQDSQTLELKAWFSAVDKSGKFKVWIYQHGILPKLLWPLLIYEVQGTIVEGFEWNISQLLRRWLGLPKSLSSIALYGHIDKLQLTFTSPTEEFKVTRAREVLLCRDSADSLLGRHHRTSSKGAIYYKAWLMLQTLLIQLSQQNLSNWYKGYVHFYIKCYVRLLLSQHEHFYKGNLLF